MLWSYKESSGEPTTTTTSPTHQNAMTIPQPLHWCVKTHQEWRRIWVGSNNKNGPPPLSTPHCNNNNASTHKNVLTTTMMVMSFVCSKCEQTTTRNAQLPWKAFLLAKTEITGEPTLVLKLDYMRKWIYAEELSPRSHVQSTCRGFLANMKVKRDKSHTGEQNMRKRILCW